MDFKWGVDGTKVFETLKEKLINVPLLILLNFSKTFEIKCDASINNPPDFEIAHSTLSLCLKNSNLVKIFVFVIIFCMFLSISDQIYYLYKCFINNFY